MDDGAKKDVGYRLWHSTGARAVFLLVHGLGAHAGRWEAAADFFAKRGVSSYAVELRDVDLNAPGCHRNESFKDHYARISRLIDIVRKGDPGKKMFLVGESMGALISFIMCARAPGLAEGLILLAPAFALKNRLTVSQGVRMVFPMLYNPHKQFDLPFTSALCTRDEAYIKILDTDSREYRTISSRMIFDILTGQVTAGLLKKKMTTPVLFLTAGEDKLVDSAKTKEMFKDVAAKDKEIIDFPGMYHSISVDTGRERVFSEMLRWAEKRI